MNVLIVGGERSLVFGNLQRNLNTKGIHIGWHVSGRGSQSYRGIPQGCQGVLVVRDMVSHALSNQVVADANKANVRNACIERKWSKALPILTRHGFVGPVDGKAQTTATLPAAQGTDVGQLNVNETTFDGYVMSCVGQDFDKLINPTALTLQVQQQFPQIAADITEGRVIEIIAKMKKRWTEDPVLLRQDALAWLCRKYEQYKVTGRDWPAWEDRRKRKAIFGSFPNWTISAEARGVVFGSWAAANLYYAKEALAYLRKIRPQTVFPAGFSINDEIVSGRLKGIQTPKKAWLTTELALQDYAEVHFPLPKLPDLHELVQGLPDKTEVACKIDKTVLKAVDELLAGLADPQSAQSQEANEPAAVTPKPAQSQEADLYFIADLIETGLAAKLESAQDRVEKQLAGTTRIVADLADSVKADLNTSRAQLDGLAQAVGNLLTAVQDTAKELNGIKLQVVALSRAVEAAAKTTSERSGDETALLIGRAALAATGAEVRLSIGKPNTPH